MTAVAASTRQRRLLERASRARELGIVAAIAVVFIVTTIRNHAFAHGDSIQQLLAGAALIALLGAGETLVIVTRNVDLSVGSVLGLSAYLVGDLYLHHPHMPLILAYAAGIGVGLVCGAVIGAITTVLRVPSLVVTLAALYVIRGVDALIVNGKQIDPTSIPNSFQSLGSASIFNIPWLAILVAAIVAAVAYAMRTFRSARDFYAIGSNPQAAALAGVPVGKRVFTAFLISGGLAGLAGVLFLSEFATVASTAGNGYELSVVAAVVVGGVAIFGGSGTVLGAALGALLLNTINQALVASQVSAFWNQAVAGFLLLAAIAFDRFVSLRISHALATRGGRT
ncbi:MAG TPA: ABC transporter permease [Micromonosporaceae bacterium]|jgi:rhamnose transport system permease protein